MVVADGFTGNVVLKLTEGMGKLPFAMEESAYSVMMVLGSASTGITEGA